MIRHSFTLLIFVALLVLCGCQEKPESAESVAQKVVQAHGGAEALRTAQGFLFHGLIHSLGEEEHGKVWVLFRQPDLLRVVAELADMKVDRLYINGEGWLDSGTGFEKASGMDLDLMRFQAEHLMIPLGLLEKKYQLKLLEKTGESAPTRLLLTDSSGTETIISIDPINSVVRMVEREIVVQDKNVKFGVVYEDYRPVKGLQMPFRTINFVNGKAIGRSDYQSVQTNPSLPENIFSSPGNGAG